MRNERFYKIQYRKHQRSASSSITNIEIDKRFNTNEAKIVQQQAFARKTVLAYKYQGKKIINVTVLPQKRIEYYVGYQ